MGKVASGLSKQVGNTLALPGDVSQGNYNITPQQSGSMSEEDAFRLNQANDTIGRRAVNLARMRR